MTVNCRHYLPCWGEPLQMRCVKGCYRPGAVGEQNNCKLVAMLGLLSKLIRQSGRLRENGPLGSLRIESTFATVRLGASESKKFHHEIQHRQMHCLVSNTWLA